MTRLFPPKLSTGWSVIGFERLQLGYRILLLLLAVAVPLNVLSIATIRYQAKLALEDQSGNLLYSARSIAAAVNAEVGTYTVLAEALARSPALLAGNLDAFEFEARRVMPLLNGAWVLVADLDGQVLLNLAPERRLGQRVPLALEAQREAIEKRSAVISDVYLSATSQKWLISINVPVLRENAPFRILAINVSVDRFLQLLNPADMPSHWLAAIVDRRGRFVARVPQHEKLVGELASIGFRTVMQHDGIFEFNSLEGDPIVQGNAHAGPWTIGVAGREAALEAAAQSASRSALLVGLAISTLSLMLAAVVSRSILQPLNEVREKARALLAGSQATLTSKAPEAVELWEGLQTAVRDQQSSKNRFLNTFENAGVGMAHLDLDGRLLAVNEQLCVITGYSRVELLGKRSQDLADPADVTGDLAKQKELVAGTIPSYTVETRLLRKDGTRLWVAVTVSLARTVTGEPDYLISVTRDISARKHAEENNRLLLREVNHRSKNLLTVVMAVARHTRANTAADFMDRFAERVQGLSKGQDLLIHNDWNGVDLGALIQEQLGHLADLLGSRIELSGPLFTVSPAAAQTIGMALHELATNASKYGALSNADGRVRVQWSVEGERFSMSWSETGGPPVIPNGYLGFGTTVIVDSVRAGLFADVAMEFLPEGVQWRMSCPVDKVLFQSRPLLTKS